MEIVFSRESVHRHLVIWYNYICALIGLRPFKERNQCVSYLLLA